VRKAYNLPPPCAFVTKSENLNFLGPSGPLRACNGIALPFLLIEEVSHLAVSVWELFKGGNWSVISVNCDGCGQSEAGRGKSG